MPDLLTLIGSAIERLKRSVELFETSQRDGGLQELFSVIEEIDRYLAQIDDDPLLKLSPVDRAGLGERLETVKGELAAVIERLTAVGS